MSAEKDKRNDDFSSLFIPASELGLDIKDFMVDPDYWNNEMYELYKDSCQSKRCLDESLTKETYIDADQINNKSFSAWGRTGIFRWYALTVYFDRTIHKMDKTKEKHNENHVDAVCNPFPATPIENLFDAINNDDGLVNILQRNPIVANTFDFPEYSIESREFYDLHWLTNMLNGFLEKSSFGNEIFEVKDGVLSINKERTKGKDVVMPFIWATNKMLKSYGELSKKCIDNGANTVVGIFISRQVPSMDGREPVKIPHEYEIPPLGQFGFGLL